MRFLKPRLLFILLFVSIFSGLAQTGIYDPSHLFSVDQLKEDFLFYRKKLEKIHPNLYLYTPKKEMDIFFDSLYGSITIPMTEMDFYNTITLLNSKIKDGHTMQLPSDEATTYFKNNGKFFPFYIFASTDKMFVNMNCSSDTSIYDGDEILSINGIPVNEIMQKLLMRQIRDGDNQTYPLWILNTYFKSYFSFTYGHPGSFAITYKNNNRIKTGTVSALSNDSINYYRLQKYSYRFADLKDQQGITLELKKDIKAYVLTIKDFHNEVLKNVYHQDFKKTISDYFSQLAKTNIDHLVIDIRNNQGGDVENGKELLSYLIDTAFAILDKGPSSGIMQPAEEVYRGKVYVLINGGSFSNSGIVSSCLQKNKRATFIGEETGGNKTILSGNAKSFVLPNTKINCEIAATEYLIRANSENNGHGVFPDYYVPCTIEDIINNRDNVKEFTFNLIGKDEK